MKQNTVTLVTTFTDRAARTAAEARLRAEQARIESGAVADWRAIEQVHFLSLFIIPGGDRGRGQLVLEANFDGDAYGFRAALVANRRSFLDALYAGCEGYPGADASDARVRDYLRSADVGCDVFYVGCPGRDTAQIEFERALGERLEQAIRQLPPPYGRRAAYVRALWKSLSPVDQAQIQRRPSRPWWTGDLLSLNRLVAIGQLLAILAVVLAFYLVGADCIVKTYPACIDPPHWVVAVTDFLVCAGVWLGALALAWWTALLAHEFPRATRWRPRLFILAFKLFDMLQHLPWAALWCIGLLTVIGVLAWKFWVLVLVALAAAIIYGGWIAGRLARVALRELDERVDDMNWDGKRLARMREREDRGAQNHFVSVTRIKSGPWRALTLWITLRLVNAVARLFFNPRGLAGIPSIHFARWVILPDKRRLLFVTNYDGAWGGYLTDFVIMAGGWMNAIWGHSRGFPRTYFQVGGGTFDEQRFKCFARNSQVDSLLWYRRYPQLTVLAIERNAAVRADLARWAAKDFGFRRGDFRAYEEGVAEAKFDAWLRRF